ncbi:hypothetical protein POM88_019291 [Heracleum sosnowskyi]|uniref:Uncharacterized protein n=1 Tax=Heracleum sosnowskyi TaxID=360622 RepID=A0AAD8N183_9APIA|nr:hypothetical protein POM88_019291 [Heracleum sosnowskyi]
MVEPQSTVSGTESGPGGDNSKSQLQKLLSGCIFEKNPCIMEMDCVGAIDGTHVQASVPIEIQGSFAVRKDGTTQNVLAAITFDLKFSYVLAGWEGSAHDCRVLNDALSRCDGLKIAEVYAREEKIAKRENHKFLTTITSSSFCRFLVVCPGEGGEAVGIRCAGSGSRTSTKNSVKPVNKAMKGCTSGLPPHDPEHQEELHRCPSDPNDPVNPNDDAPNDDAETTFSAKEPEEISSQEAVEKCGNQTSCGLSLMPWMAETEIRWSKFSEKWNEPNSRDRNKTSGIPKWDAWRPTKECTNVVHGIVNGVADMKMKEIVQGSRQAVQLSPII